MSLNTKCNFCPAESPYTFEFPGIGVWCCKCRPGKAAVARWAEDTDLDEAHKLMSSHSPYQSTATEQLEELLFERFALQLRELE